MTLLTLDPTPLPSSGEVAAKVPSTPTESDAPAPFAITSVAWAPSCGRSYHLIATGGRDGHVRIWRVKPPALGDEMEGDGDADGTEGKWSASIVGDFDDHKSAVTRLLRHPVLTTPPFLFRSSVGRVEWNITGCVLIRCASDA